MRLVDKYRPKALADIIGQDKAVGKVQRVIGKPDFDRGAFWIDGGSGTGKTSLALALARELGAQPIDILEYDGDSFDIGAVRHLKDVTRLYPLGPFRVIIVNEAHAITAKAVQGLLTILDDIKPRQVWIFTTTEVGDLFGNFDSPLLSRCYRIPLTSQGLCTAFAEHVMRIVDLEGLPNGKPLSYYENQVKRARNNLRAVLQEIETL